MSPFFVAQQRPRITEHPTDAVAAKEEPLTLNCKATGRPPPDIIWFHNSVPLVPDERKVILPEGSLFFLRYVFLFSFTFYVTIFFLRQYEKSEQTPCYFYVPLCF